jgi:RHS repeat-associated protein
MYPATLLVVLHGVYAGLHFQPSYAIDGLRHTTTDGGNLWRDEHGLSSWLEVDFSGAKTIDEVDVVTEQIPGYENASDPTATQTFSSQGATAYEVQYWTGSAWATVPGGAISGNSLVWKKLTFTSITTTKIRLVVTGSSDGVARIVEVEAWGTPAAGSSTTADIQWLVTDQLGTPRMVFDKTGSLANMKRHDYMPFGEELGAGIGGRTSGIGFGVADGIRQKFTSKERDNETGLDYFLARYYSSTQGRFISADAVVGSALNPQTLNLYAYVHNNPLAFTDPTGNKEQSDEEWRWQTFAEMSGGNRQVAPDDSASPAAAAPGQSANGNSASPQAPQAPQNPTTVLAAGEPPTNGEVVSQMNTVSEQQVRDFNGSTCVGKSCDCVPLVKALTDTTDVHTSRWREGEKALGNTRLPYGTPIATFFDGRYPSKPKGNHGAILLDQVVPSKQYPLGGILVLDQFPNRGRIGIRVIENRQGQGYPSDDASRFSVIWYVAPPGK